MRLLTLLIAVLLHGCATPIGQSIVNPNVTEAEWKAEQQYFVEQIETFCFDRAWNVNPLSFSQDRPLHGSKNYNLWGRITDDMTGDYTSDFHYVCHLTANIPMNTTIGLNDPVYHVRRSSPWAYSNRRQSFHQLLQNRYSALETTLSASTNSHKTPSGIGMLLRDGETQINVQYFEKNSGVRLSVYRRQIFEGNESNLSDFPAGSKIIPSYEVSLMLGDIPQRSGSSFVKVEAPVSPIKLVDILSFDQMSAEQLNELQIARDQLSQSDKARLQAQTKYNFFRFKREMTFRQSLASDLKQYARESAAFERELAEREAASNRAIFANVVSSLQSQTPSRSSTFNSSTSSSRMETNGSFNSSLAPWGNINAEIARAKQMKQNQFNLSQAKSNNISITQSNRQLPAPTQLADQNRANIASTTSESKPKSKSKIYEPMPEKVQKTTDTWFSSQAQALAYARLKAANQVTSICRGKGARTDSITFKEIEAGIAPSRWNYSAPDCRQGGFSDKEWKCEATVSGTCYRME